MATLADGVWYPVARFANKGSSNIYTLVIDAGGTPTIAVSNDGGTTSVNLTDPLIAASSAVDLVLSRNSSIRATLNGAVVQLV
jgi:hypothetical protein